MLMRPVGASYERCGKAKMQGVRREKLTDHRELVSIPRSITHLNWKSEKGEGLPAAGNNPSLNSGYSARRMRANVRRRPALIGRVTWRQVRRFSLYLLSLAIPRA